MHIALLTRARAVRCLLAPCIGALLMAMHGMAGAQAPAPRAATDGVDTAAAPATLYLHNRQVATFRQSVMGDAPADRVRLAELALQGVLQQPGDDAPRLLAAGESMRVELRGVTLFYLTAADLSETPSPLPLEINAQRVLHRLQLAIAEYREARDPRRLLRGAAQAAGASTAAIKGSKAATVCSRCSRRRPARRTRWPAWASISRWPSWPTSPTPAAS